MNLAKEKQSLQKAITLIKEWTNDEGRADFHPEKKGLSIDLIYETGGQLFLIECKSSSAVPSVSSAIESLEKAVQKMPEKTIPVVVVPFMGEVGRDLCNKRNISWLDLSGNAHITAPGLRIYIEGKPNQYKTIGRPKDVFAPKSSRIARRLLINPDKYITQRELTYATDLDEGLVSRVVREMEKSRLLVRNSSGAVKPLNPDVLLDAWYEKYAFSKHQIIKGFIAHRSDSNFILKNLVKIFEINNLNYAATGLSAAWLLTRFATYRTASVYLSEEPSEEILKKMNFIKGEKGSNFWLVIPNDEGVFDGASDPDGVYCVHPVQIYLDLKAQPERAKEAAQSIRENYLNWGNDVK